MATLFTTASGLRCVQFKSPTSNKRKSIRLGRMPLRDAETILGHVEKLIASRHSGRSVDDDTAKWLGKCGAAMLEKLTETGVIVPTKEEQQAAQGKAANLHLLGPFLDDYKTTWGAKKKPGTLVAWGQSIGFLKEHFGANKPLQAISRGDAAKYRLWLEEKVGLNTARRHCGRAKQFFAAAVEDRLLTDNPFIKLKDCSVQGNKDREYFLSLADAHAVLEACPDLEWRLIFALARFGGFRTPSETLLLKLTDVDWERGRIRVTSPKTEHHAGKGERFIPIFPELKPLLLEAAEQAADGQVHFVTRYRDSNANLRTQFERIIKRAGLKPWPKLFQNLRSTRETELAESYPIHVVCAWMGNSTRVAQKHYLQVTADHFAAAAAKPTPTGSALQNALQQAPHTSAQSATKQTSAARSGEESPHIRSYAAVCAENAEGKVTPTGLEPVLPP